MPDRPSVSSAGGVLFSVGGGACVQHGTRKARPNLAPPHDGPWDAIPYVRNVKTKLPLPQHTLTLSRASTKRPLPRIAAKSPPGPLPQFQRPAPGLPRRGRGAARGGAVPQRDRIVDRPRGAGGRDAVGGVAGSCVVAIQCPLSSSAMKAAAVRWQIPEVRLACALRASRTGAWTPFALTSS